MKLLKNGHTFKSAYEILFDKKKITMKYDSFRRYTRHTINKEYDQNIVQKREDKQDTSEEICKVERKTNIVRTSKKNFEKVHINQDDII